MPRYKLTIEYDGTPYAGWQRQENGHTVQAAIEQAIFKFCGETVSLGAAGPYRLRCACNGAGRACGFDERLEQFQGARGIERPSVIAGETVGIINVELVGSNFDARFSATGRHYLYRIINRRPPAPLEAHRAWWVKKPLDENAMHDAAQRLIGTHDFTTFRATQCQSKSPVKTLDHLSVARSGEIVEIRASARSFLHNQIRSFVGTLNEVGCGRWDADDVTAALEARDRKACGPVAPPYGLYLIGVDYPIITGSGREIPSTF